MTNVLIVDDEKIEREGLKYLLSREEGERNVFEASNGKQALQIIRSEDIQLVLTDIKMPHMDGLELSRRAKEENPALQIIIFSGYSDFTFAQEAIRYGVTEYILKPVNPEDFHKVIQKAEKVIEQRKKKESREIKGKNILILNGSITTGSTLSKTIESVLYYGGIIRGVAAIFSRVDSVASLPVHAIFKAKDVPDYHSYPSNNCPMCQKKQKIDALVSGYGYSTL